jgi:hypothetical protein
MRKVSFACQERNHEFSNGTGKNVACIPKAIKCRADVSVISRAFQTSSTCPIGTIMPATVKQCTLSDQLTSAVSVVGIGIVSCIGMNPPYQLSSDQVDLAAVLLAKHW